MPGEEKELCRSGYAGWIGERSLQRCTSHPARSLNVACRKVLAEQDRGMNYNDEKVVDLGAWRDVRSAHDLHITMSLFGAFCVLEIMRSWLQQRVAVKYERKSHWTSAHFLSLLSAEKAWLTILAAASYELVIVLPKPRRCCERGQSVDPCSEQRISEWVLFPPSIPQSEILYCLEDPGKFLANPPPPPSSSLGQRQRDH